MKRQILISLILLSSVLTMKAQLYTPSGTIQGSSENTNVGIGTPTPEGKLVITENEYTLTIGSGAIGFNRNYVDGAIYDNSSTAWQINGNNSGFAIQGFNGALNEPFKILNNGNIGIGTPTPDGKVVIAENGSVLTIGSGAIGFNRNYVDGAIYDNSSKAWQINGNNSGFAIQGFNGALNEPFKILNNGDIGVGTPNPQYKLDVIGTIRAREIKVDLNGADFVFEKDYKLMPLNELEKFVKEQKHLPEIASAKEMEKNGTELGDLNSKLLQKMEEMTLYIIEQNKKIELQNQELQMLKEKIEKLESASR